MAKSKQGREKKKPKKNKEAQLNFLGPKMGQAKVHDNPTPYWGSVASKNKSKKSNDTDVVRVKGSK